MVQLSTSATGKRVALVRARRSGQRLPAHAQADLARFAGLTARWWPERPDHLAATA